MSHITTKGQVTIPKAIREKLGLKPGDDVDFVEERGIVRVEKRRDMAAVRAALNRYNGFLKHLAGQDPDALVEEMRGR